MTDERRWIVLFPGSRWTNIAGTDHQLALAMASHYDVLWVDPAHPVTWPGQLSSRRLQIDIVARGISRLQVGTLPGASRPVLRELAVPLVRRQVTQAMRQRSIVPDATVVMSPRAILPSAGGGVRVLMVTDDWIAGASLMGLDGAWIRRILSVNIARAEAVVAVTTELAETLAALGAVDVSVISNGATVHPVSRAQQEAPVVGLVGQLNERLDVAVLESVADAGVPILAVGPLAARDPVVAERLEAFLNRSNVTWAGAVPYTELGTFLGRMTVGMTPYADTAFNRASYPLKTLEYLAAGIPVVCTDLPAARALGSEDIHIAADRHEFVRAVVELFSLGRDGAAEERRRAFGASHSWGAKADELHGLVEERRR